MDIDSTIVINGGDVDEWISGLKFIARLKENDCDVEIDPSSATDFNQYDKTMWLEWVRQFVLQHYMTNFA